MIGRPFPAGSGYLAGGALPGVMNPVLRPSKPGRMSFFSRLSFFLFFVSWIRDWMLVFLLREGGEGWVCEGS